MFGMSYHFYDYRSLIRYVLVSVFGYVFAVLSIYFLNKYNFVDPRLGYSFVYLIIYILQYPITVYYIYRVEHKKSNLLKYALYLFLNWSLASFLYFLLTHVGLGIFQSFILVALIMFPLRYVYGRRVYN
jgi:hypothetical protein